MDGEKIIVWSLRLIKITIFAAPLAFYYFASESPWGFLIPGLTPPSKLMSFNPGSLHITSMSYHHIAGNTYSLSIGLFNAGNIRIGLKEVDVRISVSSLDISGRLVLQSPFILNPGGEETMNITFLLERGTHEGLLAFLSQKPPLNLSGKATLVLDSAELPFNLSITDLTVGSWFSR